MSRRGATCNRSSPRSREASTTICDSNGRCRWDGSTCWPRCVGWTVWRARRTSPAAMRIPPSSLSRRLDRLEEEGWIARHRHVDPDDHRAVEVELTPRGRTLWREMSITYRRSVQARFAARLADEQIDVITALNRELDPSDERRLMTASIPVVDLSLLDLGEAGADRVADALLIGLRRGRIRLPDRAWHPAGPDRPRVRRLGGIPRDCRSNARWRSSSTATIAATSRSTSRPIARRRWPR